MQQVPLLSLFIALLAGTGFALSALLTSSTTVDMYLSPTQARVTTGDTLTVSVMLSSTIPVNVFQGDIRFNPEVLTVQKIDYNTSIADLWAEKPWYSNGEGTLNFIGGTTQQGGFTGKGTLVTITFRARAAGNGNIVFENARVLQHDGIGSDTNVRTPLDNLFVVTNAIEEQNIKLIKQNQVSDIAIVKQYAATDLNKDGRQTMADISIFMVALAKQDLRADFNNDQKVSMADLSILMGA